MSAQRDRGGRARAKHRLTTSQQRSAVELAQQPRVLPRVRRSEHVTYYCLSQICPLGYAPPRVGLIRADELARGRSGLHAPRLCLYGLRQ